MPAFFVPGKPIAQPRHKFRVIGKGKAAIAVPYLPKSHAVHAWKALIASTYERQRSESTQLDGPLLVTLGFVLPRPDAYTTKRGPNLRAWHDRKPDPDNLSKAVMDALTGVAWRDDAQVAQLSVGKVMASAVEQMGVWIEVCQIATSPVTGAAFTPRLVTPGLFE